MGRASGDPCICSAIVFWGGSKSRGGDCLKAQLLTCLACGAGCWHEVLVPRHTGLSVCPLCVLVWASSQCAGWIRGKKEPDRSYFTFSYLAWEMMRLHFCQSHRSTRIQEGGTCTPPLNGGVLMSQGKKNMWNGDILWDGGAVFGKYSLPQPLLWSVTLS